MRRRKPGFTLIELMAVVAVILILMSLLLPALSAMRMRGMASACMNNVKTLGLAHTQLLVDQDGVPVDYNVYLLFFDYLEPYHAGVDVPRKCPEAKTRSSTSAGAGSATEPYRWGTGDECSYGINGFCYSVLPSKTGGSGNGGMVNPAGESPVWGSAYKYPDYWFKRIGNSSKVSAVPLFLDAMWPDGWPVEPSFNLTTFNIDNPYQGTGWFIERFLVNRHGRRNSVVFMDGHVQAVPLNQFWNLSWHTQWSNRGVHASTTLAP